MQNTSGLRQLAKKIPPVYWLVGFLKYLNFRRRLQATNVVYAKGGSTALPPPMLRYRVHGALDESSYTHVGRSIASCLVQCLQSQAIAINNSTILDFACGPGRVAVEFKKLMSACHLYGTDIDEEAIEWAQSHLPDVGEFATNDAAPPTRYADDAIDVVYSISLFTHLDEATQNVWLAELARIIKPGGTLLTTIHGALARASCTADELAELDRNGIAFRVDRKGRFKLDGLPDFYQTTFHTREYVAKEWNKFFEVVDHIEGGLDKHQDLVVLRRRT